MGSMDSTRRLGERRFWPDRRGAGEACSLWLDDSLCLVGSLCGLCSGGCDLGAVGACVGVLFLCSVGMVQSSSMEMGGILCGAAKVVGGGLVDMRGGASAGDDGTLGGVDTGRGVLTGWGKGGAAVVEVGGTAGVSYSSGTGGVAFSMASKILFLVSSEAVASGVSFGESSSADGSSYPGECRMLSMFAKIWSTVSCGQLFHVVSGSFCWLLPLLQTSRRRQRGIAVRLCPCRG